MKSPSRKSSKTPLNIYGIPTHRAVNTLEAGRVTRYHAAPSVAPQNVAHHSWNVAVLALHITGGSASNNLIRECLMHDAAEYFTGDVPFTVKRDNADVKARFDAMEDTARENDLVLPPIELSERDAALLKICDTLDGFIWCAKMEKGDLICGRWYESLNCALRKFAHLITTVELNRIKALSTRCY